MLVVSNMFHCVTGEYIYTDSLHSCARLPRTGPRVISRSVSSRCGPNAGGGVTGLLQSLQGQEWASVPAA